jgi:hypothetical protein
MRHPRQPLLLLFLLLCTIFAALHLSCGALMSDVKRPDPPQLPLEPESSSELLAASHLFIVEVLEQSATPWARGADGLEHRVLSIKLRLLEPLKGELQLGAGDAFNLKVAQRRENALDESDYRGFWSHGETKPGERYLVMAKRPDSKDPAVIMQEPSIQSLSPVALVADVKAALAAEQQFGPAFNDPVALLTALHEKRAGTRGSFARYVWARVAPKFAANEDAVRGAALWVIRAKDAHVEIRESLVGSLFEATLALDPTPERTLALLKPYLALLRQPDAAPLHDRLVQVPIHNLIFREGQAPPAVEAVVPDAAARAAMQATVSRFNSDRAKAVAAWLAGKNPRP